MKRMFALFIILAATTVLAGCIRANPVETPTEQGTAPINEETDFIGEEKAKQIALERAGVSPDDAVFERIELDRDNGMWQYKIDFRNGRTEYDVDVNAENGNVIVFETDYDD